MTFAPRIEALLRERIGLDAASVGPGGVERALRARMTATGAGNDADYWNLLHAHADEFQALIECVVVPETWFFRHRESMLALGRFAAARMFGKPLSTPPVRILSVPCSTGEEPYSIAMALLDAGLPPSRFHIDAIDISARALERARAAEYGPNAFRGLPLDYRARHFSADPTRRGHYVLHDHVRERVRLRHGNLLDTGMLAGEAPYDFVFCRNLLIYFDPPTQRAALARLDALTHVDGMLFVGPAEASLLTREGYAGTAVPLTFAFTKPLGREGRSGLSGLRIIRAGPSARLSLHPAPVPSTLPFAARPSRASRQHTFSDAPDMTAARAEAETGAGVAAIPLADPLAPVRVLADRGETSSAIAACEALLAARGLTAEGLCLLGILHDAMHDTTRARDAYRKALYLDPAHRETLYHMAAILDADGDSPGAARMRARAHRAERNEPAPQAAPHLRQDHG